MTRCTFCGSENAGVAVVRCGKCGKSLVARSSGTEAHRAPPVFTPVAYDREQVEREARKAELIRYAIIGVVGLVVLMIMAPRLFGLVDPGVTAQDVKVTLSDFDIEDAEEDFKKSHSVDKTLILHLVVTNKGEANLKRLDANILVRSKDITLGSSSPLPYTFFRLVKPEAPVKPGDAVKVDAKFPVARAKSFGFVEVEWETKIELIE